LGGIARNFHVKNWGGNSPARRTDEQIAKNRAGNAHKVSIYGCE